MVLEKWRKERKRSRLQAWVEEELRANPNWRVVALEDQWLCPFCGQPGARLGEPSLAGQRILAHLDERCLGFTDEESPIRFEADVLEEKALRLQVRKRMASEESWQVRDAEGHWYCPFCAGRTEARIAWNGKVNAVVVDEVMRHLQSCRLFRGGASHPKSLEHIRRLAKQQSEVRRTAARVKNLMASNPVWRLRTRDGIWACPMCRSLVHSVRVWGDFQLLENAPETIAGHLMERCPGYQAGMPLPGSVTELRKALRDEIAAAEEAHETRSTIPAALIREITEELLAAKDELRRQAGLSRSLEEARRKQLQMLPKPPQLEGFDIATAFEPCEHLAGDFYDFVELGKGRIGVVVGDVSGHGIDAALVMGMARKAIHMQAKAARGPVETLQQANVELFPDLDRKTFLTVAYGVLDTRERTFRFARAGQTPLLLFNPGRDPALSVLEPAGMALGIVQGARFDRRLEEFEIGLISNDILLWYTDGLAEAVTESGEQFGQESILELLRRHGRFDARYLVERMERALKDFCGGRELADDITLLCIKVN